MADNVKNENFDKAIKWATEYLETHPEPREVRFMQGVFLIVLLISLTKLTKKNNIPNN